MSSAASQAFADPIRSYLSLRIKDDDVLVDNVLMTCFSSFTADPVNLGVMGPASVGKSYPIVKISELFPNAELLTGSSAKAFFYDNGEYVDAETHESVQEQVDELRRRIDADEKDAQARTDLRKLLRRSIVKVKLDGRILVFLEPPDSSLFEALKPILSHDKWETVYQTVDKAGSGEMRTRKILLSGWPAFIFASAKNLDTWSMWPELKSRCVIVTPKMDPEKYRQANELTGQLLGLPSFALKNLIPKDLEVAAEEEVQIVRQNIEMLMIAASSEGSGSVRDNFVFNPFAKKLHELFPHDEPSSMRKFRQLLKYVNLLAVTNLNRRPSLIVKDQPRGVVAVFEDVHRAVELLYASIRADVPQFKLNFYENVLLPVYERDSIEVKGHPRVYHPLPTKRVLDYARETGMKTSGSSLRKVFLEPLEEAGLVSSDVDPDDKRAVAWTPIIVSQKYGGLRDRHNFEPSHVKEALKRLQSDMGDYVGNFAYPRAEGGRLVSDYEEFVEAIMGPDTVQKTELLPSVPPLEPSPEQGEVEEFARAVREHPELAMDEKANEVTRSLAPTPPVKVQVPELKCSVCGIGLGTSVQVEGNVKFMGIFTFNGKKYCDVHARAERDRKKEQREAQDP